MMYVFVYIELFSHLVIYTQAVYPSKPFKCLIYNENMSGVVKDLLSAVTMLEIGLTNCLSDI